MASAESRSQGALTPLPEAALAAADAANPVSPEPGFSIGRFKLEAAALLLLLLTFAAIQFQDLFTSATMTFRPGNVSRSALFGYGDQGNGGRSIVTPDPDRALSWSCDLRPGFRFPFCGYGVNLDAMNRGLGRDLSDFDHATIRLRYSGPAAKLRMNIKNLGPAKPGTPPATIPGDVSFAVAQGEQTIRINLDEIGMPVWWALENKVPVRQPPRDNVTAIEIQPGEGAPVGHYSFAVESITLDGQHLSEAQFYLAVLAIWVVLLSGFLVLRVLGIRRKFETRHQRQLREARELQFARAVAERSSAAKSAFLANMSHELRTPLNAILGYAQLLEQGGLGERDAAAARTIRQSGTHLLTLITDILDLSKIEAGRLELDPAPFDVHACVSGVADMMRIRASEKAILFTAILEPGVPLRAVGDEKRLRQVLINLLGNAIKFTQEGEVSLLVSPGEAARDTNPTIRIEVRDTGVGMREDELARVFEPFEQAGQARQRAGGTGLGLSISRQIVALMGGRIHVASSEAQGSRFWFEIALEPADPQLEQARPAALAAPSQDKPAPAPQTLAPPPAEQLDTLLTLARAGNMRAIRAFAESLAAREPEHAPFAERLTALAAAYQSRAILELVSGCADKREAA